MKPVVFVLSFALLAQFDFSIFNASVPVKRSKQGVDKYPHIGGSYEVIGVQNMFVGKSQIA